MSIEKHKPIKQSVRELESHHFNQGLSGEIDHDLFKANEAAFKVAEELLLIGEAKLTIDIDSQNSSRALVKNKKGEIIFSTTLPGEIEKLADIAYR